MRSPYSGGKCQSLLDRVVGMLAEYYFTDGRQLNDEVSPLVEPDLYGHRVILLASFD
jgi:hypothetical protein